MTATAPAHVASLATLLREQEDRLSNCVHCGFCLPACPTYTRLGDEADSPRGRLHLMRAVSEGRLDAASPAFQTHMDRCLGCRACETVCPSGVEYGYLLERARQVGRAAAPPGLLSRFLLAAISRPVLFRPWMWASRALRGTGVPGLLGGVLPQGSGSLRLGMAMLGASSPARFPSGDGLPASDDSGSPPYRGRVALLRGCVQDQLFRRVNEATRRVLEVNGWEVVEVEGTGCCGALHAHAGALDEARVLAVRNVRSLEPLFEAPEEERVDFIVANAAGCGATQREYGELLPEREGAHTFGARTRDISELLAGEGRRPRAGAPISLRVAYDPPCHLLHAQRVSAPPLNLLRSIPGVEVVEVPKGDECCGGAGIYGITHPDLGGQIGKDKVQAILSVAPDVVATGNPGCAMQIGAGLSMEGSALRVAHPVELLDESYRRAGYYLIRSEPRSR